MGLDLTILCLDDRTDEDFVLLVFISLAKGEEVASEAHVSHVGCNVCIIHRLRWRCRLRHCEHGPFIVKTAERTDEVGPEVSGRLRCLRRGLLRCHMVVRYGGRKLGSKHGRDGRRRPRTTEVDGLASALIALGSKVFQTATDGTCHDVSVWAAGIAIPSKSSLAGRLTIAFSSSFEVGLAFSGLKVGPRLFASFSAFALDMPPDLTCGLLAEPAPFVFGAGHLPVDGFQCLRTSEVRDI
jgi:hypothetical protein